MAPTVRNLAAIRRVLRGDSGIQFALVFGSVARGTARPESDLDVAILTTDRRDASDRDLLDLAAAISSLAGREAQFALLRGASLELRFAVASEGQLLWARDRREVQRFRAHAFIEHADMEPMASMVRRAFFARVAAEGTGDGHG